MRKLLGALAACVIIVSPLAAAIPAQASGPFDLQDNTPGPDGGVPQTCLILSNGAGSTFTVWGGGSGNCRSDGHSDFSLINKNVINGVTTYEIENLVPAGCMNVGSDGKVHDNSCQFGDSTEEWIQSVVSDGQHWKNVHTSGFLTADCSFFSNCPGTILATPNALSWATPGS